MTFSKYRAKRVSFEGRSFMSQGEAECYAYLKILEKAGEITLIQCQPNVLLTKAKIRVIPDFLIEELPSGRQVYIDFKGFETPAWGRNKKLWKHYGPAPMHVYKKLKGRISKTEEINPILGDNHHDKEK